MTKQLYNPFSIDRIMPLREEFTEELSRAYCPPYCPTPKKEEKEEDNPTERIKKDFWKHYRLSP